MLLISCDVCGRANWQRPHCAECAAWATSVVNPGGGEPVKHVIVPSRLADEMGGQWKVPDGEMTLVYRLSWVRNGRALYTFVGMLEGLGAARI